MRYGIYIYMIIVYIQPKTQISLFSDLHYVAKAFAVQSPLYRICHICVVLFSNLQVHHLGAPMLLVRSSHTRPPSALNFFKMRELCYTNHASWFKLGLSTRPGDSQERCHTAEIYSQYIKFCWTVR